VDESECSNQRSTGGTFMTRKQAEMSKIKLHRAAGNVNRVNKCWADFSLSGCKKKRARCVNLARVVKLSWARQFQAYTSSCCKTLRPRQLSVHDTLRPKQLSLVNETSGLCNR
jgi:hypothetical protein